MLIVFIVLLRPVKGLNVLRMLKRLGSKFLKPGKILVETFFFSMFIYFKRRLMALRTANIYFSNARRKIENGFGLRNNSFLHGLLSNIFLPIILIGLGTDRWF